MRGFHGDPDVDGRFVTDRPLLRDLSDWMADLIPNHLSLAEVSMPGTHNSATFALSSRLPATVLSATRCQGRTILEQLAMGVRFLDLRVRPGGGLCHSVIGLDLSLRDVFQTCTEFLEAHPGEVVIARVKDEGNSRSSAKSVGELLLDITDEAQFPLYLEARIPVIGQVRGRIVIFCDWAGGELGLPWAGDHMRIQDDYWKRTGGGKWRIVRQNLLSAVSSPDCLDVSFTSATHLPDKVPATFARSVNPKLAAHLRTAPCGRFAGIIVMDFPSVALCELVVRCNRCGLDPCRQVRISAAAGSEDVAEWLENIQCEALAASTRADAALILGDKALSEHVHWLSRVYSKLLVERMQVELGNFAVDLGAPKPVAQIHKPQDAAVLDSADDPALVDPPLFGSSACGGIPDQNTMLDGADRQVVVPAKRQSAFLRLQRSLLGRCGAP